MSGLLKFNMDERMTGTIVFVDDDDDDCSNCSIQSVDDVNKPDVRRGILRNPKNNHQSVYVNKQPVHYQTSSPNVPRRPVSGTEIHEGASIFWPDWEIKTKPHYHQNEAPEIGFTSDLRETTGNKASSAESWETHGCGSNAVVRKKLTVRFSPEAEDACMGGNEQHMRRSSDEFRRYAECHHKQDHGDSERRRLNIGRIAENKFNDGRNYCSVSDSTSSATRTDSFKTGRKWYHFSFRSNKNRGKTSPEIENQPRSVPQLIHAEPRSVDKQDEFRCRGRREMRDTSTYRDDETCRALAVQGYQLLPSSVSEPEQLGGQGRWGESSLQDWNQRVLSTDDLRRSPMIGHESRKSRGAAVRRSRSTVGDDRRRTAISSPTPESAVRFHARRNSTHLTDHGPPSTTGEIAAVAVEPRALTSTDQQARLGWYYGLDGPQPPATTHSVTYYTRHSDQVNVSTGIESKRNSNDTGYPPSVTATGGEVVWSGHSWTTPRQLRTSMTPVEGGGGRTAIMSNGVSMSHEMNTVLSSNVASNYIRRRGSYLPVTRLQSQNWTLERHWNVGRELPLITVTPATDERRRRRLPITETQESTTTIQGHSRPRDYTAIYAWSPELPAMTTTTTTSAMKRSSTFADEWNLARSDVNGYIDPASHRGTPIIEPACRPYLTVNRPLFFSATNFSYGGDFVDMRGICRAVVSAADLLQIELFYRSHKTEVISCACAARLYFASVRRHSSIPGTVAAATQSEVADAARWYPTTAVGVPVIILDCGGSRCRDRKLSLVLAEVGSGFALWRDAMDHLTCYRVVTGDFHCLRFSHDHSRLAGLRFADPDAADTFSRQLDAIMSGPGGNALLNLSSDKLASKLGDADFRSSYYASQSSTSDAQSVAKSATKLRPKLKKCDISGPCCFEHITKFESIPGFLV